MIQSPAHHCPECGAPTASALDDNCPTCLMRLAAPAQFTGTVISGPIRFLGDYELLEEIARGGMGVIYRARQMSLNRIVAVKVVLGGAFATEEFRKRFRHEAQAAASLNHPNIVSIYEVGEYEGQPYFSMELIEGRTLAELSRDNPLPATYAAQLVRAIATGVHYAHERGLLHRDLKPSNILVDALNVPHITDFGLAKRVAGDVELTLTGQILGSPSYMSPEQAEPGRGPTTAASDVYSLGSILYHLLTGRPPFMAESVARTLQLVVEGEAVSPRLLNPGVSSDLETICLKCLELEPRQRYASAQEVADELGCLLRDEPIRARPISSLARLTRWCRRKPALAVSLGVVAVLLLIVALGSAVAVVRIEGERERSEIARQQEATSRVRAEAAEHHARQQLYTALVEQAHASVRSGEIGQRVQALDAIRRAATISNSVALRREALAAFALPDLRFERALPGGGEHTMQLMDPAFENVAVCRGRGPVEIRAVSDWRLRATLPASTNLPVYVGWWSADRSYLAIKRDYPSGDQRADLEVWKMPEARRVLVLHDLVGNAMSFHPRSHRLIAAQADAVKVWDLDRGEPMVHLQLADAPGGLSFAADGEHFAVISTSAGFKVSVHDATTGALQTSHSFSNEVLGVDWQPGGRWLAVADRAGSIHLMNPQSGATRVLGAHKAQAVSVVFSPDGDYLLSGGWEGELLCWDLHTMQRSFSIGRQSWVAQFCSDGRQCALITETGVQLYAFERPMRRGFVEDLGPRLRHAAFSPDGRWLAAAADESLGVWDLSRSAPGVLTPEIAEARTVFTPDGAELFASNEDGQCSRWRILPGTNEVAPPLLEPMELPFPAVAVAVAAPSNSIAFTGAKGSRLVRLDEVSTGETHWVETVRGINEASPDGRWLGIFGSYSQLLHVYGLPDLAPVVTLTNQAFIGSVAFSPQGDQVAICSRAAVDFWSTKTWARTRVLPDFMGILFTPDPSVWWLTRDFRTAGLYDATTLESLLPLPTGTLPLALSRDGRYLAVSVNVRHLQLWDLGELRDELRKLGLDWDNRSAVLVQQARR